MHANRFWCAIKRVSIAVGVVALTVSGAVNAVPIDIALKSSTSTDWTDIWWNPSESGWGLQMVQTGSFIYVTIYVYGSGGAPTWFGGGISPAANNSYAGTLYTVTGPYYGGAFNPASVAATPAGTMTFVPTNVTSGTFTYTINGATVTKSIQRQPLTSDNYSGTYRAAYTTVRTGCTDPALNVPYTDIWTFAINHNGTAITVGTKDSSGGTCTLTGSSYVQLGRAGSFSGNYTCSDGDHGGVAMSEMNNGIRRFFGRLIFISSHVGCSSQGVIAGVLPN